MGRRIWGRLGKYVRDVGFVTSFLGVRGVKVFTTVADSARKRIGEITKKTAKAAYNFHRTSHNPKFNKKPNNRLNLPI